MTLLQSLDHLSTVVCAVLALLGSVVGWAGIKRFKK